MKKKNCIRETPNLSTDTDSSTDIFVSAGVKKGLKKLHFSNTVHCSAVPQCSEVQWVSVEKQVIGRKILVPFFLFQET